MYIHNNIQITKVNLKNYFPLVPTAHVMPSDFLCVTINNKPLHFAVK